MSKRTEKVFNELQAYLDAHHADANEEAGMNELMPKFVNEYNASIKNGTKHMDSDQILSTSLLMTLC